MAARKRLETAGPTATRPSARAATSSPNAGSERALLELPTDYEDEVRFRAYELWEQRGRRDGYAEEDWLDAEREIFERYKSPAA